MTLAETLGVEQDLLLDLLPLPQVTEQEVQGLHWVQLSTLGHLWELHTEDSTLAPSHFSSLTKHILLLARIKYLCQYPGNIQHNIPDCLSSPTTLRADTPLCPG